MLATLDTQSNINGKELEIRRNSFLNETSLNNNRDNLFLSKKELAKILDRLLQDKESLLDKKVSNENFCLATTELADPLDEASANIQASHELRFRNRDIFYLKKIDKSLKKVTNGTYGLCTECDEEISFERLLARPTADLCICCKEEAELGEKTNIFGKRSKSLGQSLVDISFKS